MSVLLIALVTLAMPSQAGVIGWFSRDKRLKEIDVTDGSKIERLNMRYHIRQSKGEFHPWQNAD